MPNRRRHVLRRITQAGASAVEFALILPALLGIVYGGIAYGYIFFLQQRINFAAEEAVRAAIALDPAQPNYLASIAPAATTAVTQSFIGGGGTLPAGLVLPPTITPPSAGTNTISITVSYNLLTTPPLFPTIVLPVIGAVPSFPALLTARATGRLS